MVYALQISRWHWMINPHMALLRTVETLSKFPMVRYTVAVKTAYTAVYVQLFVSAMRANKSTLLIDD